MTTWYGIAFAVVAVALIVTAVSIVMVQRGRDLHADVERVLAAQFCGLEPEEPVDRQRLAEVLYETPREMPPVTRDQFDLIAATMPDVRARLETIADIEGATS